MCFRVITALLISVGMPYYVSMSQGQGKAEDHYYMLIFAQQSEGNIARLAHTFATFVKTSAGRRIEEVQTISWLPETLDIRLLRAPERGTNLDLESSLRLAKALNTSVFMWGPYRIQKALYDRAAAQVARLNSGTVAYKVLDTPFRPNGASNCIHAISDLDTENGLLNTGTARGVEASLMVLKHLQRWIIDPSETHEWVSRELGVDGIPREGLAVTQ